MDGRRPRRGPARRAQPPLGGRALGDPAERPPRIEVTVPVKRRSANDLQIHHARLEPDEIATRDGIPVTTPARTLVDLAAVLPPQELDRAVNQAQILRLRFPDLVRYRGRRGTGNFKADPAYTRSDLEAAFLAFVDAHGLPKPLVNPPLDAIEPDFRWPRPQAHRGARRLRHPRHPPGL